MNRMNLIVTLIGMIGFNLANAQQNCLQKIISISIQNRHAKDAIKQIEKLSGCLFAYNSNILNKSEKYNAKFNNTSIANIIDQLFDGEITSSLVNDYIVLKKSIAQYSYFISGKISGNNTPIENATIYEKQSFKSALSNSFGEFKLQIKTARKKIKLFFRKINHRDTMLVINNGGVNTIKTIQMQMSAITTEITTATIIPIDTQKIYRDTPKIAKDTIQPHFDSSQINIKDTTKIPSKVTVTTSVDTGLIYTSNSNKYSFSDSLKKELLLLKLKMAEKINGINKRIVSTGRRASSENVADTFERYTQFSFVPALSTNGFLAPNTSNHFSINILAGYNGGVNGFEAGSVFNIIKRNVNGFQAAGVFNTVGENIDGFQAAGVFNIVGNNFHGFQAAGVYNLVGKEFNGFQAAGFLNNTLHKFTGLQAAGAINQCKELDGFQAAGFLNIAGKNSHGLQMAGAINIVSGDANITQIAGFTNIAKNVNGAQIGIVNIAKKTNGLQLGVFNIAKEVNGAAFGLISIVGNGIHALEFEYNSNKFIGAKFKTGVHKIYNILSTGIYANSTIGNILWTSGYGIGSEINISKKIKINLDIVNHFIQRNQGYQFNNFLAIGSAGILFKASKNIGIFGASNINVLYSHNNNFADFNDIIPKKLIINTANSWAFFKGWSGFQVGLRFF